MLINRATAKMQAAAESAKQRLESYGFNVRIETDYMNGFFKTVEKIEKTKYVTTSVVIGGEGIAPDDEYCLSIGAAVRKSKVEDDILKEDINAFDKMVDETLAVLDSYEDKLEGLRSLTEKANAEYEKMVKDSNEQQKKFRRISIIGNVAFFIGVAILLAISLWRYKNGA